MKIHPIIFYLDQEFTEREQQHQGNQFIKYERQGTTGTARNTRIHDIQS